MRYLNVKINWKLVEKINAQFEVHSNESVRRKIGRLGLDQVYILQNDMEEYFLVPTISITPYVQFLQG